MKELCGCTDRVFKLFRVKRTGTSLAGVGFTEY